MFSILRSDYHLACLPRLGTEAASRGGRPWYGDLSISQTTRYRRGSFACLLLGVALAAIPGGSSAAAQVREIDPNGLYPAATPLASPLTGIAFTLPAGFRAEWDASIGGLLALANDGALGAVWGWSEGTLEEVASEVGTRLEAQGVALQARGEPDMTVDGMRGTFDALTDNGNGILHVLIRSGPEGGVIAVVGLGAGGAETSALAFVDGIQGSLEWTRPGAVALRSRVTGTVLGRGGAGSDSDGDSLGRVTLSFCTSAQYAYESASGDRHTGGWWLVGDLAGTPTLFLEATDGRTFQWSMEESGDGFLIDGDPYRVTGTC